jgi:hypothetical protein
MVLKKRFIGKTREDVEQASSVMSENPLKQRIIEHDASPHIARRIRKSECS